jgi:hypothetical protein
MVAQFSAGYMRVSRFLEKVRNPKIFLIDISYIILYFGDVQYEKKQVNIEIKFREIKNV